MPSKTPIIRPLDSADLSAALAIQSEAYPPFLREGADAFASRLDVPHSFCLAASDSGTIIAYLLAHGWRREDPPPLGVVLSPGVPSEVLFIHDLAVASGGRGSGVGRKLVARAFELASDRGLSSAELIAVEGAAAYWRTLGFAEASMSPRLAAKVAEYGPSARWMTRRFGPSGALQP
ncbi:GNAT family N-acetyltransferase [Novosphingobium sp. M1R2S20]|uniref:GNAT family N-acetyltransferase n=1 Tax=Novosphingobium rhizovicinum TaxID=3228928 RepID=A0ABV3RFL3_9SPHN